MTQRSIQVGTQRVPANRKVSIALALGMAVSPLLAGSVLADANWTGATSNDWNTTTNWDANPAGQNVIVNTNTGNIATLSADQAFTPVDIIIGAGTGANGRVDHRAGLLTTGAGNWMFVGANGGTGVYNLANTATTGTGISGYGTGSGSLTVAGNFYIGGRYFDAGGNGTVNINTTGTITAGLFDVFDSDTAGTGVVNLENGTVHSSGELWVGAWGTGSGTMNQSGGTVQVDTWLAIGRGNHDGGTGTYNLTGGTVNVATNNGFVTIGSFNNAVGTINVTGGTMNSARAFYVGEGGKGNAQRWRHRHGHRRRRAEPRRQRHRQRHRQPEHRWHHPGRLGRQGLGHRRLQLQRRHPQGAGRLVQLRQRRHRQRSGRRPEDRLERQEHHHQSGLRARRDRPGG